jgi:hypothetical protein
MGDISATLSLCTEIAKLAIWAIILWFVCPWIGMSDMATKIVRALIVAIAIMVSLNAIIGMSARSSTPSLSSDPGLMPEVPSILAPEKRHH